ncbi:MAG: helix-turn-helix domain-containing protein, partial [Ruminococcus sp.]|nr:helix-turn-helix domain-containing protein [Ruminococcus sp.]
MTLNERIKAFRKLRGLSQKEFAEKIGISQRSVSWGEQPGNNVPDNTIKNICMAYGLNEEWLRNGTEPMYIQIPTFSLDDFVKQHGGTELEVDIMKAYFELEPVVRAMLVQHFRERLTASRAEPSVDNLAAEREAAEAAY